MPVIGVTGTNGKTTTAYLLHYLIQSSWRRCGMVGTVEYRIGDEVRPAPHTTPESAELQELLAEMRDSDCRAAVMEVSSHGLVQHRVDAVRFAAGIFTNLTQDHLDYHKTMDAYFAAKRMLFEKIDRQRGGGALIVNSDDRFGAKLAKTEFPNSKMTTFGQGAHCDFQAGMIRSDFHGTQFQLSVKGRKLLVKLPLIGHFNVYNAVGALAAAQAIDLNLRESLHHLESAPQVPGRLESVGAGRQINYRVYVDYAHTPDALENALKTLRDLRPKRIITVFGCGGDRDRAKRPQMGAVVDRLSDVAILTSDNPRTEDPGQIIADTKAGIASGRVLVIEDRREAIAEAIKHAGPREIVLIAGKGHEDYQEIDGVRHHFDDREEARNCIAAKAES
jgi:UDP-N-acetylmuramoyl-L-alanyl-D-glutamate--2,6-diaminopimelate ligase